MIKQLLDLVFVISRKKLRSRGKGYQPLPLTSADSAYRDLILDIAKTSSDNCLILNYQLEIH